VPVIYSSVFFDLMMCDSKIMCTDLSDVRIDSRSRIKKRYQKVKKTRANQNGPGDHQKKRGVKHGRKNS
jgi:hypothetical protein